MGRILVIPNSDFSRNSIVKVDIEEKVERTMNDSSTVLDNNSSSKNNDQ